MGLSQLCSTQTLTAINSIKFVVVETNGEDDRCLERSAGLVSTAPLLPI